MSKSKLANERKDDLILAATVAREKAYAPYSKFRVGAAVLMTSGKIYTGCNVENVSYGLSMCAERVALGSAVAAGDTEIVAVAIVTDNDPPVYPCGACLQVIQEFAGSEPPVIIVGNTSTEPVQKSLSDCLPCAFSCFTPKS